MKNIKLFSQSAQEFTLPRWAQLPDIELYMDQVVSQLCKYFAPLNTNEEDSGITASMVNNYVKQQLLPAPIKKKYGRIHLAHLVVICMLKQVFSIPETKTMLNKMFANLNEDEIKQEYDNFCTVQENAFKNTANAALKSINENEKATNSNAAMQAAVFACASKVMAQALLCE